MEGVLTEITRGKCGRSVNGDHEMKLWTECKWRS